MPMPEITSSSTTITGNTTLSPEGEAAVAAAAAQGEFALTPEAILAMMRLRLRDLDGQIGDLTGEIEDGAREAQRLGAELHRDRQLQQLVNDGHVFTDEANRINWDELTDIRSEAGERLTVREVAIQKYGFTEEQLSSIDDAGDIDARMTDLNEQIRDANSGNELRMVSLQSAIQQRTSVVQLGTNMLSSLHEAEKSIVGNIR